jgi:hypothetical protein
VPPRSAGVGLRAVLMPGRFSGSSCRYGPELGTVYIGETLSQGGPGATGRSHSSFDTIIESVQGALEGMP